MSKIKAFAAQASDKPLQPFEYEPKLLRNDDVKIKVQYCGICHSDVSMIENEWQMSTYPLVPGHEVAGTVSAVGENVKHLKPGDRVGLGSMSDIVFQAKRVLIEAGYPLAIVNKRLNETPRSIIKYQDPRSILMALGGRSQK